MPHDNLQLSSHCLLRLVTALMLEAEGIDHGCSSATNELNQRTGRCHSASAWLVLLTPAYRQRFCPGDTTFRLV